MNKAVRELLFLCVAKKLVQTYFLISYHYMREKVKNIW